MSRLPLKADGDLEDGAKAVLDKMAGRGLEFPNIYRLLAHAPDLLEAWTKFAWPLRTAPHADRGLREMLIMRVTQLTGATYEWAHHWPLAIMYGTPESKLHGLSGWRDSGLYSDQERAALALTDEMVLQVRPSSEAFEAARSLFDEKALIQLVLTIAFYLGMARVTGAFDLELEPEFQGIPLPGPLQT